MSSFMRKGFSTVNISRANILIDVETEAVSLIDFGLATNVDEQSAILPPRGGTQAFCPPEWSRAVLAVEPLPPVTPLTEQYALAAVLYLLLTGRNYLEQALDPQRWHHAVCTEEPLSFVRLGMAPWPTLEAVLARALSKKSTDRYPSVAALREAFVDGARSDEIAFRAQSSVAPWGRRRDSSRRPWSGSLIQTMSRSSASRVQRRT